MEDVLLHTICSFPAQDLVAMLVERKGLAIQDAMKILYHSDFHDKLQELETGLYLEGAEYLYGILNEELADKRAE